VEAIKNVSSLHSGDLRGAAQLITESTGRLEDLPRFTSAGPSPLKKILNGMTIFIQGRRTGSGQPVHQAPFGAGVSGNSRASGWKRNWTGWRSRAPATSSSFPKTRRRPFASCSLLGQEDLPTNWRRHFMTADALAAQGAGVFTVGNYYFNGVGHISVDYAKVLANGLDALSPRPKPNWRRLISPAPMISRRCTSLNAVIISNEAVITFANRFAAEADNLAATEQNAPAKSRASGNRPICSKVPAQPAASFRRRPVLLGSSSLSAAGVKRSLHLAHALSTSTCTLSGEGRRNHHGAGPGTARPSLHQVQARFNKVRDEGSTKGLRRYPMFQNLIVGGVDREGEDATNELSFMCACRRPPTPKLYQPSHLHPYFTATTPANCTGRLQK